MGDRPADQHRPRKAKEATSSASIIDDTYKNKKSKANYQKAFLVVDELGETGNFHNNYRPFKVHGG